MVYNIDLLILLESEREREVTSNPVGIWICCVSRHQKIGKYDDKDSNEVECHGDSQKWGRKVHRDGQHERRGG